MLRLLTLCAIFHAAVGQSEATCEQCCGERGSCDDLSSDMFDGNCCPGDAECCGGENGFVCCGEGKKCGVSPHTNEPMCMAPLSCGEDCCHDDCDSFQDYQRDGNCCPGGKAHCCSVDGSDDTGSFMCCHHGTVCGQDELTGRNMCVENEDPVDHEDPDDHEEHAKCDVCCTDNCDGLMAGEEHGNCCSSGTECCSVDGSAGSAKCCGEGERCYVGLVDNEASCIDTSVWVSVPFDAEGTQWTCPDYDGNKQYCEDKGMYGSNACESCDECANAFVCGGTEWISEPFASGYQWGCGDYADADNMDYCQDMGMDERTACQACDECGRSDVC